MSKIVDLEGAKLYKVTTTAKRKNGPVISSIEIYVYTLSPYDAMSWTNISLEGGCCEISIKEVECFVDSKLLLGELIDREQKI